MIEPSVAMTPVALMGTIIAILVSTIIPLAFAIWFIMSIQSIKKSLRSIEEKLATVNPVGEVKAD